MSTHTSLHSSAHLRIDSISIAFADRRVLTDISLVVPSGARVGLIGENGSGKSTLLRIAVGDLEADAGSVTVVGSGSSAARVGLLHQEHSFPPGETVASALERAITPAREAVARVDDCASAYAAAPDDPGAARAYTEALEQAERLEVWDIDTRAAAMLAGFGLAAVPHSRPVARLSGGQRARLALALLLLNAPDVLLLDEPTNHLDDAATDHLRRTLQGWRGPVLLASHDRAFLDETVTSLADLDPSPRPHTVAGRPGDSAGRGFTAEEAEEAAGEAGPDSGTDVTHFTGTYTDYLRARADAHERWEQQYRDEQAELRRLRASVQSSHTVGHVEWKPRSETRMSKKFYGDRNARVVSRRVNDARSRLEEKERTQLRKPAAALSFVGFSGAERLRNVAQSGPIVTLTRASISGRLAPVSLSVSAGERWLITGANGVGKSTLLRLIAGQVAPTDGSVEVSAAVGVGILTQDVRLPDPRNRGAARTAREAYADLVGAVLAEQLPLSTFGLLGARDENRPLAVLSLGQQRRVALAVALADPPEMLLLDEPTNHLSLLLATELEGAISEYPGTVVIASHDRWLRRRWEGSHLELSH